ncbi:MAG TPA: coproporphyrinogen-III oxidase family protein, partial [Bryobacteraceae bacterium]|nr:coproporphyrinogen-III oxidase family protein [Bryobacteraceae bacterium]
LTSVLSALPGNPWKEATIEAAPGTITREKAGTWRRLGINRVSLGAQSFDTRELKRTGRKHTAGMVAADCAILRDAGIANLNIDLIAGLPHQTIGSWRESLNWIDRIRPSHVSVYMFEVDEDSRLGLEVLNNGARYDASAMPSEETMVELYEIAVEKLGAIGIERYEISNFASQGNESLHNLKYWTMAPYVGFGSDAHGFDGRVRFANAESPQEYVALMRVGKTAVVSNTTAKTEEERLFTGLRLSQGVRLTFTDWERNRAAVERFLDAGLLESDGDIIKLTSKGVLLSNEVFQELLAA